MIQSRGALIPYTGSWGSPNTLSLSGGTVGSLYARASYNEILRRQLWVYVVVTKRGRAVARLPIKSYERTADGRREARDGFYGRLLRKPNPRISKNLFWQWVQATADSQGEAILVKVRDSADIPVELWPVHPAIVNTFVEGSELIYELGGPGGPKYPSADIVHHRLFNPDDFIRGMSPIEPLRATLENEHWARRATSAFWQNGARPGFALTHPKNLTEPAQKRLKAQFESIARGADRTGASIVLEEGMEPRVLSLSAEEAQYIDTRKLNREEVCACYDMPPPAVQILDRATFSNITENLRSLYRDTMGSILPGLEETLELQLRPDFGDDDLYAEFLMDEVLRGDFEKRQEALKKADHLTIAEKREIENLPFIPGTDRIFLQQAMVPLELAGAHLRDRVPASSQTADRARLAEAIRQTVATRGHHIVRIVERLIRKNRDLDPTIVFDESYNRRQLEDALRPAAGDAGVGVLVDELVRRFTVSVAAAVGIDGDVPAELRSSFDAIAGDADTLADTATTQEESA